MKILGNRVLVSKIEEEAKEGFATVEIQDSFVNKGKVEQGSFIYPGFDGVKEGGTINPGDTVLFAKYSPDTQEIEHEGKKMKIVKIEDILAVL